VNCLDNFDITNDGVMDLLVGREDGMIEVYGYDSMDNPTLKYTFVSF
jgi:Bardet-Biedl syndrome 7 protein